MDTPAFRSLSQHWSATGYWGNDHRATKEANHLLRKAGFTEKEL